MTNDHRDLLCVLRAELDFLDKGGYRHTARADWRPHFIFQDSPTCLNFDPSHEQHPCSDCVMMQVIPSDEQANKIPCRYIPLNAQGETIDSFYRSGTPEELEAALRNWLVVAIDRLQRERTEKLRDADHPVVHIRGEFAAEKPAKEPLALIGDAGVPVAHVHGKFATGC